MLRGDIYSLGVLLYQLLTGQLPHDTPSQVRRHAPFKRPSEINANIVASVDELILRCMAREPSDRYPDIKTLSSAFELVRQHQLNNPLYAISSSSRNVNTDWSTSVIEALEAQDYLKAAKIAGAEFVRTHDFEALLQHLNALYRANRLFEFEEIFDREYQSTIEGADIKAIRLLAIKAFLSLRKTDRVKILIKEAIALDGESLELDFLLATLFGLEANFPAAREMLETINRKSPSKPLVLIRLIQVCEQMRDYSASVGYLRHALRVTRESTELEAKRQRYQDLGLW
ncbi:hypothetical protein GO003_012210 [Methylicorpusculum oleiharenae]|uniref:hypothetical protein n=1 Tax=Methylicorpusculum oleiharenae TaxID=1338687 RepID=UPI00135B4C7B|nr:hypothetical protein [Methylicorpusculum oleiharenae]MCD2451155.1 hypothetical protein [Methylicorpusculum oleiharenae]